MTNDTPRVTRGFWHGVLYGLGIEAMLVGWGLLTYALVRWLW